MIQSASLPPPHPRRDSPLDCRKRRMFDQSGAPSCCRCIIPQHGVASKLLRFRSTGGGHAVHLCVGFLDDRRDHRLLRCRLHRHVPGGSGRPALGHHEARDRFPARSHDRTPRGRDQAATAGRSCAGQAGRRALRRDVHGLPSCARHGPLRTARRPVSAAAGSNPVRTGSRRGVLDHQAWPEDDRDAGMGGDPR